MKIYFISDRKLEFVGINFFNSRIQIRVLGGFFKIPKLNKQLQKDERLSMDLRG